MSAAGNALFPTKVREPEQQPRNRLGPIFECDEHLNLEQERLRDVLDEAMRTGKALVLPKGIRLVRSDDERMDRIEAKLDALICALAEDEDEGPTHDLEGNELPRDREQGEEL